MRKEYDQKILKVRRELDKFHFDQTYTAVLQRISSSEPEYESFLLDCNEVTIGTPGRNLYLSKIFRWHHHHRIQLILMLTINRQFGGRPILYRNLYLSKI
jgi:hypothetical protein